MALRRGRGLSKIYTINLVCDPPFGSYLVASSFSFSFLHSWKSPPPSKFITWFIPIPLYLCLWGLFNTIFLISAYPKTIFSHRPIFPRFLSTLLNQWVFQFRLQRREGNVINYGGNEGMNRSNGGASIIKCWYSNTQKMVDKRKYIQGQDGVPICKGRDFPWSLGWSQPFGLSHPSFPLSNHHHLRIHSPRSLGSSPPPPKHDCLTDCGKC